MKLVHELWRSSAKDHRAAAVWAASFVGDHETVVKAMQDTDPRVRVESIRSFAKMKGDVTGVAGPLIACLRDDDIEVRREALQQAVRWTPPAEDHQAYAEALADGLASGDRDVRRQQHRSSRRDPGQGSSAYRRPPGLRNRQYFSRSD